MKHQLKITLACTLAGLYAPAALAQTLSIQVEIPRIEVAEYHRPYVALWLQSPDRKTVRDIALWYDYKLAKDEGKKWLKDLRQWWRLSGRSQNELADGITGATQPVGTHTVEVAASHPALADLPAGDYELVVEAAREVGGREIVRLPLAWPPQKTTNSTAQGTSELGLVQMTSNP